jgi:hypothetical protein
MILKNIGSPSTSVSGLLAGSVPASIDNLLMVKKACEVICQLRPYQRKALLLSLKQRDGHSLLNSLLIIKALTIKQLANALEITDTELDLLFPRLPLNNSEIAYLLSCQEHQVIRLINIASKTILRQFTT